ncbi:MAG: DUF2336 domain-containing protein [Xanthobacteraceae bacterium]
MPSQQSLIGELETAIASGSKDKRVDALRRVTDLFVASADKFTDQQIDVFDDVLGHLIKRIEAKALTELSSRLAPINNAPIQVIQQLARDDDIAVAAPVIAQSQRLSDQDLIEIANSKAQGHLLAIANRSQIAAGVTDALLQRGDQHVFHRLAENSGASFSEHGFTSLVKHSERDERLAEKVGLRLDIPLRLFRELLLRATEAVRSRLLAQASPENRDKIQRVLAAISEDAEHEAGFKSERDLAEAHAQMSARKSKGELNEALLFQLAKEGHYADVIAALSLLCGAPMQLIESLLEGKHSEAWLIPCKTAGLDWFTVRAIITCNPAGRALSDAALESAAADYSKLSQGSAARVLRFWQVRQAAAKGEASSNGVHPASSQPRSAVLN